MPWGLTCSASVPTSSTGPRALAPWCCGRTSPSNRCSGGGGQEAGLRAGTLPTALIVGFAAAARLALQEQEQRNSHLQHLRDQLWEGLQQRLPGVLLNGALQPRLPHNLNISLPGVNGSRLHRALRPHLACSSGSACSNGAPSHVLQAIGRSRAEAEASLRLSLGRETTADDVDQAITAITDAAAAAGFLSGR